MGGTYLLNSVASAYVYATYRDDQCPKVYRHYVG